MHSELLTPHGITVADLAAALSGDVRLAAAAVLQTLPNAGVLRPKFVG